MLDKDMMAKLLLVLSSRKYLHVLKQILAAKWHVTGLI